MTEGVSVFSYVERLHGDRSCLQALSLDWPTVTSERISSRSQYGGGKRLGAWEAEQPLAQHNTVCQAIDCICLKSGVFPLPSWVRPRKVNLRRSNSDFCLDLHQVFNTMFHYILPILTSTLLFNKILHRYWDWRCFGLTLSRLPKLSVWDHRGTVRHSSTQWPRVI